MKILRTKFGGKIIGEFLPPRKKSKKAIILAPGMPSVPRRIEVMEFLAQKNFWVFYPRYQGSWESEGNFLEKSPADDIEEVIGSIQYPLKDIWTGKVFKPDIQSLYLIGSSFGGPATLLNSKDERVKRVVVLSPVVDWQAESKEEPLEKVYEFVAKAFPGGYRVTEKNWNKLKDGKFYNPVSQKNRVEGEKILIVHARDDKSVLWKPVEKFAKDTKSRLMLLSRGGHIGLSGLLDRSLFKRINKFLERGN